MPNAFLFIRATTAKKEFMFEKLIAYYNDNPTLLQVTLIVLGACLVLGFGVVLAYKAVRSKRERRRLEENAMRELAEKTENSSDGKALSENGAPTTDETSSPDESDETSASIVLSDDKSAAQEEKTSDEAAKSDVASIEKDQAAADDTLKTTEAEITQAKVKGTSNGVEAAVESHDENEDTKNANAKREAKEAPKAQRKEQAKPQANKKQAEPDKDAELVKKMQARYSGKWIIYETDGAYTANLVASNGEVLLRSESYTALSGIKSGIETINKNIAKDNFAISIDKNGKYFFKLYSSSTRLLCISEVYGSKTLCENAIKSVKRFSETAVVVRHSEVEKEDDKNSSSKKNK